MKQSVYADRFYLVDSLGTLDPSRGELGYASSSDAKYELYSSSLEHPIIRRGKVLIDRKVCAKKAEQF